MMAGRLIEDGCRGVHEAGTGTGKTAHAIATLRAARAAGAKGPLFYATPTKAQVDQTARKYPGLRVVYGRSEHPCLYYRDRGVEVNAAEMPCATLCAASLCPHEVNQETGAVREPGAEPCPYYQQKYEAKTGEDPVICTTAFFLMSMVYARDWEAPGYVVLDEAHRIANIARSIFQFDLTDYHIRRCMVALRKLGDRQNAIVLKHFLDAFRRMARRKPSPRPTLLRDEDTTELIEILERADARDLPDLVKRAVTDGVLDPVADRTTLKLLEDLMRNIARYVGRLRYALPDEERHRKPLNFVFAFYHAGDLEEKKARYHLVIKSYYVAPLIRLAIGARGLAMSATIGGQDGFRYETGITWPFHSFPPPFSAAKTRLYVPTDTPNLAKKARSRDDLKHALRTIVETAQRFAAAGRRSIVIVQSNDELERFRARAVAASLDVVSYGNGVTARDAAAAFKAGQGQVLAGTSAHFAEGADFPQQVAPVIFFLRPGYPHPEDPQTQFEERREGPSRSWAIWHRRVMIEALQVRGRNIRNGEDLGVCFFISQQFRRIVGGALPAWLEPAYHATWTLDQCVSDALELLGAAPARRTA
jgi:Rad3-related DNA helicase